MITDSSTYGIREVRDIAGDILLLIGLIDGRGCPLPGHVWSLDNHPVGPGSADFIAGFSRLLGKKWKKDTEGDESGWVESREMLWGCAVGIT